MHGLRRGLRRVALVACFAGATGLVVAGSISWLRDARLGRPTLVFNYSRMMGKRLPDLAAARGRGARTVGVLGDSTLISYPEGRTVPDHLQRAVDRRLPEAAIEIQSLAMSGSGPFDYYFLADRIAAAEPSLMLISLNLDHFSTAWRGAYSRPQLAGLIEPARLVEAIRLPLHWIGLTTDRLAFYVGVVQAGGYDAWYWLTLRQAQVGRARDRFEGWLAGSGGGAEGDAAPFPEERFRTAVNEWKIGRLFTDADLHRYTRLGLLEHYEGPLAGVDESHPVLRVLGATVRRFERAGIATLVYVAPVDVAYLGRFGLGSTDGLDGTIAAAHATVVSNGGDFIDLHDLFPSRAFRDAPGHLAYEGDFDGAARLADALAPRVERALVSEPAAD